MSLAASVIFDAIAPQLASSTSKTTFLSLATSRTNSECYGAQANLAIAYLAAHMLTLTNEQSTSGGSGIIKSKKEGDLSVTYEIGGMSSSGSDLGLTSYGKQLLSLRRGNCSSVTVTGGRANVC